MLNLIKICIIKTKLNGESHKHSCENRFKLSREAKNDQQVAEKLSIKGKEASTAQSCC